MSAPDYRYSDKMVRGNDTLRDAAWAYARDYKGDWDVMVAAHELAVGTNNLPVPIARMVLNVMRADPEAQHLLPRVSKPAKVLKLDDFRRAPESHPHRNWGSLYEDEVDLEEPPETPEPTYKKPYIVSKRWHKRYVISTHKLSRVAHLLRTKPTDPRSSDYAYGQFSKIIFVPHTRAFEVSIYSHCARSWTSYRNRYYALRTGTPEREEPNYVHGINNMGVILSDDPLLYPICKACSDREQRLIERNLL